MVIIPKRADLKPPIWDIKKGMVTNSTSVTRFNSS